MYTCIDKIRSRPDGKVQLYHIIDSETHKELVLPSKELKYMMMLNTIAISNLKLTSDYRIIDNNKNK
jgi:hypothetical protein